MTSAEPDKDRRALEVVRPGRRTLDLGRETVALFGLVFDAVTLDQATRVVQQCAVTGRRCFVSTPNVNFVALAQRDRAFRQSVFRSDLSLADGAPLVWAARLAGLPLRERVAGSDLFDHLRRGPVPLRVYFFGGPDGVAEQAAARLVADAGPLQCVGFEAPGFVSVEDMSGVDRLQRIDASGADLLVVALGAQKGQAWIERNLDRLRPMVVSHLGAVVNFVAGTVVRAPRWISRIGLEWLWRIGQEPTLWRRYARDALTLAQLLVTQVVPLAVTLRRSRRPASVEADAEIELVRRGDVTVLRLQGAWRAERLPLLRTCLARVLSDGAAVQIDLSDVSATDSALVALLLRVDCWQGTPRLIAAEPPPAVARMLRWCGAGDLLPD